MILLVNFNTYLGGGETLFVRLAEYFERNGRDFLLFYKSGSYIENDLVKIGIDRKHCCPINLPVDYFYLNNNQRKSLRNSFFSYINEGIKYDVISFCARDLYFTIDLTKELSYSIKIVHLILHDQDNLYCCQTIIDKIRLKISGKRFFSSKKMIDFNSHLFNAVKNHGVLIPMSEVIVKLWNRDFNINMSLEDIVPLPVCTFPEYSFYPVNNKKILWIGRLVDFKIPALCALLNFLKRRQDYSLTIIGYGAEEKIKDYLIENGININQVSFLGKVAYDQLGNIIKQHAIGYAMGTSIIEIAQYGLPVIMAMASPDYKMFDTDICGGLYVNKSLGNVGVDLFYEFDTSKYPTIDKTVEMIEHDYLNSAKASYNCIRTMFDFDKNVQGYLDSLNRGNYNHYDIIIPQAPFLRKLVRLIDILLNR